jgi:hypothetical protein
MLYKPVVKINKQTYSTYRHKNKPIFILSNSINFFVKV